MAKHRFLNLCLLLTAAMLAAGCGTKYPTVSGKVTINGEPAEGVSVLFVPLSTEEVPFPGPFAEGKTDKEGRYSLTNRYGDPGGTAGLNVVEFYVEGSIEVDFMKSNAEMLLSQAGKDKSHPSYQEAQKILAEAKTLETISSGDKLTPGATVNFEVPPEGTDVADFELSELSGS